MLWEVTEEPHGGASCAAGSLRGLERGLDKVGKPTWEVHVAVEVRGSQHDPSCGLWGRTLTRRDWRGRSSRPWPPGELRL